MAVIEVTTDDQCRPSEHWLQSYWRPAMAWQYFFVCLCDFVFFPALNAGLLNQPFHDWHPLTLEGGGLYHIAMGAIVSVTSYQRTREKMAALATSIGAPNKIE